MFFVEFSGREVSVFSDFPLKRVPGRKNLSQLRQKAFRTALKNKRPSRAEGFNLFRPISFDYLSLSYSRWNYKCDDRSRKHDPFRHHHPSGSIPSRISAQGKRAWCQPLLKNRRLPPALPRRRRRGRRPRANRAPRGVREPRGPGAPQA